ncbi:hypothetical protein K525DRAFT_206493 [Schizophyllum commune Loenen D]|nr:hypothetical protein K525DRAFT_206493 [Schizophyllum commune Loenen D]
MVVRSSSEIRPFTARLKDLPDNASRARAAAICVRLGPLLASERMCHELTVDPFTLPPKDMRTSSPAVSKAVAVLDDLGDMLETNYPGKSGLLVPAMQLLDRIWFHIIDWITFLHPNSGYLEPEPVPHVDGEPSGHIDTVISVSRALLKWKKPAAHLLAQTPQLYSQVMWLWLHIPDYLTGNMSDRIEDFVVWLEILVEGMYAMLGAHVDVDSDVDSLESDIDIPEEYEPAAVRHAIACVKYRPRKMYRLAIRCVQKLVDAIEIWNDKLVDHALSFVARHLEIVRALATELLVIGNHARDVVRSVVHLARSLHALRPGHEAVGRAGSLLGDFWDTATDNRSLVWALNDGAFPLLIEICHSLPTDDTRRMLIGAGMFNVAARTAHLPVIRAYTKHKGDASFASSRFLDDLDDLDDEEDSEDDEDDEEYSKDLDVSLIDRILDKRAQVAKDAFPKKCANPQCDRKNSKLRRCPCKTVYYCSKECQAARWSLHIVDCLKGTRKGMMYFGGFEIVEDANYLSHRDAMFLSLLAKKYVCGLDVVAIIDKIREMRSKAQPRGTKKDVFLVEIDYGEMPVHYDVKYVDQDSKYEQWQKDPTVIVTAKLCPLPVQGVGISARVTAWRCVLGTLEYYAKSLRVEDLT